MPQNLGCTRFTKGGIEAEMVHVGGGVGGDGIQLRRAPRNGSCLSRRAGSEVFRQPATDFAARGLIALLNSLGNLAVSFRADHEIY